MALESVLLWCLSITLVFFLLRARLFFGGVCLFLSCKRRLSGRRFVYINENVS